MVVVSDGHFLFQKSGELLKFSKIVLCKCIQLIRIAVGNYAISFFHGLGIKPWFCFRKKLYTRSVIPNHSEPRDIGDVVKLR